MVDYSEAIEVCDIKAGIHSKLNDNGKLYMYHSFNFVTDISLISNIFCPKATRLTC